jgi:hypothetical protein
LIILSGLVFGSMHTMSIAEPLRFDRDAVGVQPAGWLCGSTGGGRPRWTVERDGGPAGDTKVLVQSGAAPFCWCVHDSPARADGIAEVRFKPMRGREDQAGGVVWRWKDGDNYYVARANALENNVSLYYTTSGTRRTIRYVDAPVKRDVWHRLRVEYVGKHIRVTYDGEALIDVDDAHITGTGKAGVWTKADSITAFDEFEER